MIGRIWRQFREIGIPRCSSYRACGGRLIWPWQSWLAEIEEWPQHETCHHHHLLTMRAAVHAWGWSDADYDECRICRRSTASGFAA